MLQHVFISYRHESPEHARAVRRLGELLRQTSIPVALDQFFLDGNPGGPDEGWPKWCEDNANESACVLIIGSEGWFSAYNKRAPAGVGLGAATEADLFRQWLYDGTGDNSRIRLAFLHEVSAEQVPTRLRAWHQFRPFDNDAQLDQLGHWVADHLGLGKIELPTVHWPEPINFRPKLADRLNEWPVIVELLAGRSRERILLFEGPSGLGKSALVRQAAAYAKQLGLSIVQLELKGGRLNIEGVLGLFDLELGQHLPNFSRQGANQTLLLRKDLRSLRQPVLVILDTYEGGTGNKLLVDWIDQQFLPEIEAALALAVIVAGQQVPIANGALWQDHSRHFVLKPITEIEHWEPWIKQHHPDLKDKGVDIRTLILVAEGKPALMSSFFETIAKQA